MGILGIGLLMFVENVFPPIPSELIMPLAGFSAARGERSLIIVIIAGSLGSLLGALLWYYISKWVGAERLNAGLRNMARWLTLSPEEVDGRAVGLIAMVAKPCSLGGLFPPYEHWSRFRRALPECPSPSFCLLSRRHSFMDHTPCRCRIFSRKPI